LLHRPRVEMVDLAQSCGRFNFHVWPDSKLALALSTGEPKCAIKTELMIARYVTVEFACPFCAQREIVIANLHSLGKVPPG
jgi:hypothetical protein